MAKRDKTQGFAFVIDGGVINFNKDSHKISTSEVGDFDSIYDVLENALDLLDNSDTPIEDIAEAVIKDLEKFRKG